MTARALLLAAVFGLAAAAPARADLVIADDNIVQGDLCVGLDCADGEPFGTDTLRLKENNTRLTFVDTTGTDWEITANDSASGGQNYLGVLETGTTRSGLRVRAGSPANALVLAPGGLARLARGTLVQRVNGTSTENPAAFDGDALLSALRTLPIATYHGAGDPSTARHIGPSAAAFNAAFGLGAGDEIALEDLAGVAVAAAQTLAPRVAAASAGARGPAGATGPAGDRGPNGAPDTDHAPSDTALAALNARLARLARGQAKVRGRTTTLSRRITAQR